MHDIGIVLNNVSCWFIRDNQLPLVFCFSDIQWFSESDLHFISFPTKKNFEDTITFCRKIGGEIAASSEERELLKMAEAYGASTVFQKQHSHRFYTGFRKLPDEEDWLSLDGNLIWNNWEPSFPQNKAKSSPVNCAVSRKWNNWKFVDSTCTGRID